MVVTHDLWLCSCCIVKLANDDTSGCEFSGCHDDVKPMSLLADEPNVVPGSAERDFSSVRCDGCGTDLAGYRHEAHILA